MGMPRLGQAGRKAVASGGDKVAEDGKLGDAAMLGLHGAEAVELGLVSIVQEAQRIPEAYKLLAETI